jgi:hypothetical protein
LLESRARVEVFLTGWTDGRIVRVDAVDDQPFVRILLGGVNSVICHRPEGDDGVVGGDKVVLLPNIDVRMDLFFNVVSDFRVV